MIEMTKEEKQLKIFMIISAITYLVVGFAFAIAPGLILEATNIFSRIIMPELEEIPIAVEKFWLSLTFSMRAFLLLNE